MDPTRDLPQIPMIFPPITIRPEEEGVGAEADEEAEAGAEDEAVAARWPRATVDIGTFPPIRLPPSLRKMSAIGRARSPSERRLRLLPALKTDLGFEFLFLYGYFSCTPRVSGRVCP